MWSCPRARVISYRWLHGGVSSGAWAGNNVVCRGSYFHTSVFADPPHVPRPAPGSASGAAVPRRSDERSVFGPPSRSRGPAEFGLRSACRMSGGGGSRSSGLACTHRMSVGSDKRARSGSPRARLGEQRQSELRRQSSDGPDPDDTGERADAVFAVRFAPPALQHNAAPLFLSIEGRGEPGDSPRKTPKKVRCIQLMNLPLSIGGHPGR